MASPDLDFTEMHVSIRNYVTRQPYVTTDGLLSLDMPVESASGVDAMYEPTKSDLSSAHIVFPSLISNPELRPLLQQIKEGDRVEIFDFQPDCGDPVLAGFIPPGAITESGGKVAIDVLSTLSQVRNQHLRRYEYYDVGAAGLYKRGMAIWKDLLNDDFTSADLNNAALGAPTVTWGPGFLETSATAAGINAEWYVDALNPPFVIAPGDAYVMECDAEINAAFAAGSAIQVGLRLQDSGFGNYLISASLIYAPSGVVATPQLQVADVAIVQTGGSNYNPLAGGTSQVSFPMPQSHHLAAFVKFSDPGTPPAVTIYYYLNNVNISVISMPWAYDARTYMAVLYHELHSPAAGDYVKTTTWRVRKQVPALLQAGRFNPQTADAITYQPNNEEGLQFLQLVALKDDAEYREIYRPWPQTDELELDAVGTLGRNVSSLLGYEQPGESPTSFPQTSPFAAVADAGSFMTTPPFRFEEGWNLEEPPALNTPSNLHANDVIQTGASTAEAQTFSEKWSVIETGKPQAGIPPTYPYFEQIVNDDRVGIQSLADVLATFELVRRTDTTPSLSLKVIRELPFAGKYRAGDSAFVKTLSLRNNLEQNLRIFERKWTAGSPVEELTVGRGAFDPSMMRLFREATMQQWLYDQSGTTATIYVYPFSGININAAAASADFTLPLDAYTTGTQLVYAALHWYTDANVMNLQPVVNGGPVYTTGLTGASGTDSGLVFATQYFQQPGKYTLHFLNNDASTRNLVSAFLVLRIRA